MSKTGSGGIGAFFGLVLFAVVPLLVGGGLLTLRHYTVRDMERAKSWAATPCVMERCEYVTGDEGGRYLEIVYRYEWEGNVYRGDQLDLMSGEFGDDDIMEKRVYESFPAGATTTCYVDPEDPATSVFDREHPKDGPRRLWLLAFPFVCTGVGFAFVLFRAAIDVFAQEGRGERRASGDWAKGPASPPRGISLLAGLTVMAGPRSNHAAWLFVVGFLFVFVIMDGPASYARLFHLSAEDATVEGRVTGVSAEPGHELHKSVYRYTLEYEVGGEVYRGVSFTRGQRYDEGEVVTVMYDPSSPEGGFIAGARSSNFTWVHSAIPLGVLLLLVFGLAAMSWHNLRTLWLLRYGQVGTARWRKSGTRLADDGMGETRWEEKTASGARVEVMGRPVQSILSDFHFEVMGRSYQAKQFAPGAAKGDDPSDEMVVLYNVRRPKHNIVVGETLLNMVDGRRTVGQHLSSLAPMAMAIGAIWFMFYGGA